MWAVSNVVFLHGGLLSAALGVSGVGSPRPCQSTYSTTFYPQKQNLPGVPPNLSRLQTVKTCGFLTAVFWHTKVLDKPAGCGTICVLMNFSLYQRMSYMKQNRLNIRCTEDYAVLYWISPPLRRAGRSTRSPQRRGHRPHRQDPFYDQGSVLRQHLPCGCGQRQLLRWLRHAAVRAGKAPNRHYRCALLLPR